MTCIVALKNNGKIYIGGDSRRSHSDGSFVDYDHEPKILTIDGITFAFAGSAGIQDMFVLICGNLKFSLLKLEIISQKMLNILMSICSAVPFEILISDGKEIIYICNKLNYNGSIVINDYVAIGVGQEIVGGSLFSTSETDPQKQIEQAIKAVAAAYKSVGGKIHILPL